MALQMLVTLVTTGQRAALFFAPPAAKDLPSDAAPDRPLLGRLSLMSLSGNGEAPHTVPLVLLPSPIAKDEPKKVLLLLPHS